MSRLPQRSFFALTAVALASAGFNAHADPCKYAPWFEQGPYDCAAGVAEVTFIVSACPPTANEVVVEVNGNTIHFDLQLNLHAAGWQTCQEYCAELADMGCGTLPMLMDLPVTVEGVRSGIFDATYTLSGAWIDDAPCCCTIDGDGVGLPIECDDEPETCPLGTITLCGLGDLDCDGSVGVADLLALLACWGPVEPGSECKAADLTGNESVGVADLLALLSQWGPCP